MKRYDLVVIGGGVGGLIASSGGARLGARVALVEKGASLGGDCLHAGCVPTKRLIRSARMAAMARRAGEFGVDAGPVNVDFGRVMTGMRDVRASIGEHDSVERFRKIGVDVIFGSGRFVDDMTFEVGGERITGRKFLIATGSRPVVPPVPGLREVALTNETALGLKKLPGAIAILGGGPIGIEFAQVFARLGSKVYVIEKLGQILPREDQELSGALKEILLREGMDIQTCTEVKEVRTEGDKKHITSICPVGDRAHDRSYIVDEVMAAIGRAPNVEGLGLEAAGVEYDPRKGIRVDGTLRTTNKRVYACGDCIGHYAFTHVAEYQAGIALSNALFPFIRRKADYRAVPWVTFSDPELARVGMTEGEAKEKFGGGIKVYRHYFRDVDRAVIDGEGQGLIKLVSTKKGVLLGAHILGPSGGELLHEYVLAMQAGLPVGRISRTIHVYPTLSQAVKRAADQYYREKLFTGWFPGVARWLIRLGSTD